ncbi:MAG: glycosyltransferase [Cytophagales bacterium]|nr:glycosyltransferase [Cytophaga sp.]
MNISVIIGFYKKLDFLELILQGLSAQTYTDFEVIVAEDNNDATTIAFINAYQKKVSFPIILVQQEDKGFRKNRILNKAISVSSGNILVFFDGDCIPHRESLKEFASNTKDNIILSGRRVMLSQRISERILKRNSIQRLNTLSVALSGSKHIEESIYLPFAWIPKKKKRGLLGCNYSIQKKALVAINGFDEDYEKAGVGEDSDIEWRLLKLNYTIQPMKFKSIVYHIYHDSNYDESDVQFNTAMMIRKKEAGNTYCTNGLIKHV